MRDFGMTSSKLLINFSKKDFWDAKWGFKEEIF
jgi:hypothetical protein